MALALSATSKSWKLALAGPILAPRLSSLVAPGFQQPDPFSVGFRRFSRKIRIPGFRMELEGTPRRKWASPLQMMNNKVPFLPGSLDWNMLDIGKPFGSLKPECAEPATHKCVRTSWLNLSNHTQPPSSDKFVLPSLVLTFNRKLPPKMVGGT